MAFSAVQSAPYICGFYIHGSNPPRIKNIDTIKSVVEGKNALLTALWIVRLLQHASTDWKDISELIYKHREEALSYKCVRACVFKQLKRTHKQAGFFSFYLCIFLSGTS